MYYKNINVLLLDGSSRQLLPILYDIKELGCHVTTLNNSKSANGYVSRYPNEKLIVKNGKASRDIFNKAIDREIRSGKYDVVVPFGDGSTDYITANEDKYEVLIGLACAPRTSFIQAYNKQLTFEKCLKAGVPCPLTRQDGQDIEDFLKEARFPIIIKPRRGTGSVGFRKIETEDILKGFIDNGKVNPDDYVIQECVVNFKTRYYANVFIDKQGVVKSVVSGITTRWFPVDAGAGSMCLTAKLPEIIDSSVSLLMAMNWRGFAQVDYMLDPYDNIPKIIEINGRIPAGVKTNRMAGVSLGRQLVEYALGKEVTDYKMEFKENVVTRCMQTDFLWFLKSPDRFRCKPAWFRFWRSYDTTFSLKDPLPFFTYSFQHLITFKKDIKKRKH